MYKIIIDDSDNNFLIFDLRDILSLINDGAKYSWVVNNIEASFLLKEIESNSSVEEAYDYLN